jgi:helix-turn-helix protein
LIATSLIFPAHDHHRYLLVRDQLLSKHGGHLRWYADGAEDEPKQDGREAILDAVIATQTVIDLGFVSSWEEWEEIRKALPSVRALDPKEALRLVKQHRREHIGRAVARGEVNVTETASIYGVSRSSVYEWAQRPSVLAWVEKTGQSHIGRGDDLRTATTADLEAHTEAIRAHIDARVGEVLAVVLEAFPENTPAIVENSINRLVEDALGDADVNVD